MVKSMTAYAKQSDIFNENNVVIEIRSFNSRFFECNVKTPKFYGYLDIAIKKMVRQCVVRGKVEVNLHITNLNGKYDTVVPNVELAKSYSNAILLLGEKLNLENDITLSNILKFNDIFTVTKDDVDEKSVQTFVENILKKALHSFCEMRNIEGESIKKDILLILKTIERNIAIICDNKDNIVKNYEKKLFLKMQKVLENQNIDKNRILLEVGIFSEKVDINEEISRFNSHIKQFYSILNGDNVSGKLLDFLTQEMNREVNTICSKMAYEDVINSAILIKNEVEKLREQIQNME